MIATDTTAPADIEPRGSVAKRIVGGTSALGAATLVERGLGFVANFLAARLGGPATFGAYSLALTTAGLIANYASGGIGSTATRFAGEHGEAGGRALIRALAIVSLVSASIATIALGLGAETGARVLLHNGALAPLLRWAALMSGAAVLLECCRGYLIGMRHYRTLLIVALAVGAIMLIGLPVASRLGPQAMVLVQSVAALSAVVLGTSMAFQRGKARASYSVSARQLLLGIWRMGAVQLASIVGLSASGWWVASLVTRSDPSMVEMGLFAASSQLRNMAALIPGLLTQSSYGMLAQAADRESPSHHRVLALCSFGAAVSSIVLGGGLTLVLPWVLPLIYGKSFTAAVLPGSLALATAIVHMSASPAAARLTIVSLRLTAVINGTWALLVLALAARTVIWGGASMAAAIYLVTHVVSAIWVFRMLRMKERVPEGLRELTVVFIACGSGLGLLAAWRHFQPAHAVASNFSILLLIVSALVYLVYLARRSGWIASNFGFRSILELLPRVR